MGTSSHFSSALVPYCRMFINRHMKCIHKSRPEFMGRPNTIFFLIGERIERIRLRWRREKWWRHASHRDGKMGDGGMVPKSISGGV